MRAFRRHLALAILAWGGALFGDNQTPTTTPILPGTLLPFKVTIEQEDFGIPHGYHSGSIGEHKGKWLIIGGRTNGLHGFEPDENNFPPQSQNTTVYVVNPKTKRVVFRSLTDPSSGLTQEQVDFLSVTSPQFYQDGRTLYITGGYGVDSSTGDLNTKPVLTAINIPGLMHWVTHPDSHDTAAKHIRQIQDPVFQVTGGVMAKGADDITLLIFGQNFTGFYLDGGSGIYTEQVRRFVIDNGKHLSVRVLDPLPPVANPDYHRRDLNVVPIVRHHDGKLKHGYVALSGVFTLTTGVWTVPVTINLHGESFEPDPTLDTTFKQGMNNYVSGALGLFSKKQQNMYEVLFGGLSYGYFQSGEFVTDSNIPFINQVTTVKIDSHGNYSQYIMPNQFPVILSTTVNPGNQLLFGTNTDFMPAEGVKLSKNGVIWLDDLPKRPKLVGWLLGGIVSTQEDTNTQADSFASEYIFRVMIERK